MVQNEDPLLMESPEEKKGNAFLSPQPHGHPKLLDDYSVVKTVLFPPPGPLTTQNKLSKFLSPKAAPTPAGVSKHTHVVIPMIPDLSRFINNESLATIDRDLLNQHQSFINNNPHFENSHRSLKGLFRKTSKPTPFGGSS